MSRRHLTFTCEGDRLFATLDEAEGAVGLLLVTGGNETRSGPFAGQAEIAALVAARGYRVFRFDRRGVGDSAGENRGFRLSGPDIAAALEAFRSACPHLRRVAAFGNCDAASALMLAGGSGADALILANPWTFDDDTADAMPTEAVRARYLGKLKDPKEWARLLRGDVSLRKLVGGLKQAASTQAPSNLAEEMRSGIAGYDGEVRYLIAGRDRTGIAFRSAFGDCGALYTCEDADHAFSSAPHRKWLLDQLGSVLEEQARQLDMG